MLSLGLKLSVASIVMVQSFSLLWSGWKATPCLKESMPRLDSVDVKPSLVPLQSLAFWTESSP